MKKYLILDIDNTLISCKRIYYQYDISDAKNTFLLNIGVESFLITKRPGLNEFLLQISEMFDIYTYTSASQNYADKVLDRLESDINKKIFIKRFYITDCIFTVFDSTCDMCKDINKLGLDVKNTIIIDDRPDVHRNQFYNVIFIQGLGREVETIFLDIIQLLKY